MGAVGIGVAQRAACDLQLLDHHAREGVGGFGRFGAALQGAHQSVPVHRAALCDGHVDLRLIDTDLMKRPRPAKQAHWGKIDEQLAKPRQRHPLRRAQLQLVHREIQAQGIERHLAHRGPAVELRLRQLGDVMLGQRPDRKVAKSHVKHEQARHNEHRQAEQHAAQSPPEGRSSGRHQNLAKDWMHCIMAPPHGAPPLRACSRYFCARVAPRRGGMQGGGPGPGWLPCPGPTTPQTPRLGATLRAGGLGGALPRCSPLVVETTTARPAPRIASAQTPGAGAEIA